MSKGRLLVLYPQTGLDAIPSLMAMIRALAANSFFIDVYTVQNENFTAPEFVETGIRVITLTGKFRLGQLGWHWQFIQQWLPYLLKQSRRNKYQCLFGVDQWGLLLAGIVGKVVGIPVVYLSLEIFCWSVLKSPYLKIRKLLEIWLNGNTAFTIIQDWDRAALLIREHRISRDQLEIFPNAPEGVAHPTRTDYFRRVLGISPERPILLVLANCYPVQMGVDLAREAKKWNSNWALVFHTRNLDSYAKELLDEVDNQIVYFSGQPVASRELRLVIASADIGIALYSNCAIDNLFYLGHSSGKIAHYLQVGLPIVAPDLPSVKAYIEKYECGVCVGGVAGVYESVQTIIKDYERYSNNAIICFREEFDVGKYFPPILARLEKIIGET